MSHTLQSHPNSDYPGVTTSSAVATDNTGAVSSLSDVPDLLLVSLFQTERTDASDFVLCRLESVSVPSCVLFLTSCLEATVLCT